MKNSENFKSFLDPDSSAVLFLDFLKASRWWISSFALATGVLGWVIATMRENSHHPASIPLIVDTASVLTVEQINRNLNAKLLDSQIINKLIDEFFNKSKEKFGVDLSVDRNTFLLSQSSTEYYRPKPISIKPTTHPEHFELETNFSKPMEKKIEIYRYLVEVVNEISLEANKVHAITDAKKSLPQGTKEIHAAVTKQARDLAAVEVEGEELKWRIWRHLPKKSRESLEHTGEVENKIANVYRLNNFEIAKSFGTLALLALLRTVDGIDDKAYQGFLDEYTRVRVRLNLEQSKFNRLITSAFIQSTVEAEAKDPESKIENMVPSVRLDEVLLKARFSLPEFESGESKKFVYATIAAFLGAGLGASLALLFSYLFPNKKVLA